MKVQELFEGSIGFDAKRKMPTGEIKDWLAAMGATSEDVDAARAEVMRSQEYKALLDAGFADSSSSRHVKNGSIDFTMTYQEPISTKWWIHKETGKEASTDDLLNSAGYWDPYSSGKFKLKTNVNPKMRTVRLRYTVLPHGKIDFTAPNDYHRWPQPSGKPALVKGNPQASIVKSMTNALRDIMRLASKRLKQADKLQAELSKKTTV